MREKKNRAVARVPSDTEKARPAGNMSEAELPDMSIGNENADVRQACEWIVAGATDAVAAGALPEGAYLVACKIAKDQFTGVSLQRHLKLLEMLGEHMVTRTYLQLKVTHLEAKVEDLEKRLASTDDAASKRQRKVP